MTEEIGLYNLPTKIKYLAEKNIVLNDVNYNTHPVLRIFILSQEMEEYYKKDLYEFTFSEFERFFYAAQPSTITASENFVSQTALYVDWAIEEGLTKRINPLTSLDTTWRRKFGKHNLKTLWTNMEMNELIKKIPEPQIAVVLSLLFNGVRGKNLSELSNLKESDVNYDEKKLTLTDEDGKTRVIEVDQLCIDIIRLANAQEYYKSLDYYFSNKKRKKRSHLIDTPYILRKGKNSASKTDYVDSGQIHKRLEDVQEWFGEYKMNPHTLVQSGRLAYAFELYMDNNRVFDQELVDKVFEKFKMEDYHQRARATKEYLNEETLLKVYKIFQVN